MREALPILRDLIEEYPVIIAILPTGYGKSRFFQYNPDLIDQFNKVVHVLPLRAIVAELADDLRKQLGDGVGYQAGIHVEDVDKTPFLADKYTIVTFDSFFMNFYGIPVSEIWRSVWHSDVAFLLSRISHIVLDEIHLVVTPSEIDNVEEEFTKILLIVRDLIRWNILINFKTIIFTATFYPWMFTLILPSEAYGKTAILLFAPEDHEYVTKVKEKCNNIAKVITIWNNKDDFYFRFKDYINKIPTYLHYTSMDNFINSVSGYDLGSKIAVMFNSVRRCIESYEKYYRLFENLGYTTTILHGQMTSYARRNAFDIFKNVEKIAIFSTQVIEAGVNMDFDSLITEIAPPHALIQRTGRVARYDIRNGRHYAIHLILGDKDLRAGVNKLCKGIYDIDLTISAIKCLENYASKVDEYCMKTLINWRLPQSDKSLDYLKLLIVKEVFLEHLTASSISSFIEYLTKWRGRAYPMLKQFDEYLKGSFIRSSTLIPIYLGPVDVIVEREELNELLDKYTITIDIGFLERYGERILDFQENGKKRFVKLAIVVDDEKICIVKGPIFEFLLKYPLYSLHTVISKIRKSYEEDEGGIPKVFLLGLKANPSVKFDTERGYILW
ncbi:MAG: CRISPR-associated helicase Cas3' [Candidatus Bathyarchaeia archaeon]